MKKQTAILLTALLLLAAGAAAAGQALQDGCYNIILDSVRKELAEAGKFPATSELPSAYYSDFFGRLRLRALSRQEVLAALVPRLAEIAVAEPPLRLRFAAGYTVVFYLDTEIAIDGNRVGFRRSFVECVDFAPAFKDRYGALADFLGRLEAAGLRAEFLEPNPYFGLEKTAAADLKSDNRPKPSGWPQRTPEERAKEKAEALAGFERAGKAVLMFGDTHGSEENFGTVWGFLTGRGVKPGFDWLGLEMLTLDEQPLLDAYFKAAEGSSAFRAAEDKLRGILLNGWDKRFANAADSPDGHYFRLVLWARKHKIPVYALDAPADYNMFRYGEFPLGATTRNLIWVAAVPTSGKGVVYGGSAHFVPLPATPYTFQDYLKRRDPWVETFLVR